MAIWNLGSINIDYVYQLEHLPRPGETIAAKNHGKGLGGKGANQSIAAAMAGAVTQHLGAVGAGDDWVIERLREKGVGTEHIIQMPDTPSGHAIILLDSHAENSIVIYPGANRTLPQAELTNVLQRLTPSDTLLIQNETNLQVKAAETAKAAGARVIYSAAPFDLDALSQIAPHVSILAMNAGEAEQFFAANPAELAVEGLLITRGADGAEYRDLKNDQKYYQASFSVDPVDTTGAGDTFTGYFAAALDRGDDIPGALRLASAAAALKVTRTGAGDAIPALNEVMTFLAGQPSA